MREPSEGGFELKDTWMSVQWKKDENIFGEFRLGTLDQYQPTVFTSGGQSGLGLLEAWLQLNTNFGRLRVGRIPISDGFEGSFGDSFWLMPVSEVKKRNWLFSRDEGLTYEAETKPWLTSITVHNGEAGANLDNKMWVTGRFQYFRNTDGNGVLVTATEGSINPASSLTASAQTGEGFRFDSTKQAKVRWGTLAIFHLWQRDFWNMEFGRGDNLQDAEKYPFAWGRVDLSKNLGGDLNFLLRYEQTQSDLKAAASIVKISALGLLLSSSDQLSSVTLFLKHKEEAPSRDNDEALLLFRINSTAATLN